MSRGVLRCEDRFPEVRFGLGWVFAGVMVAVHVGERIGVLKL